MVTVIMARIIGIILTHPRDFTARNTFFLIGGLLLFGLGPSFLLSVSPRLSMRIDILAESINAIDFSMLQVKGQRTNRPHWKKFLHSQSRWTEPDTAFVDELSDRIKYLKDTSRWTRTLTLITLFIQTRLHIF